MNAECFGCRSHAAHRWLAALNLHSSWKSVAATIATAVLAFACTMLLVACGGGTAGDSAVAPPSLWDAEGRAITTPAEHRPADRAAHWSGQRYATTAQLVHEELLAAPLTMTIHADDEAAVESAMVLSEVLTEYGSHKSKLGIFVRSKSPTLAARLAERLTREEGWANVFVVF